MANVIEIEKVLNLYGTREKSNIEIANAILEGNAMLKAQLLSHAETLYGWCKGRTYTHTLQGKLNQWEHHAIGCFKLASILIQN